MQPTSRFGEVFQYSNLMAAAAGYVAAAVAFPGRELGAAYDEAMRTRIFEPLGMTHTTFDFAKALAGNVASRTPKTSTEVRSARMDLNESVIPVRPAGGIWTSARDLSRYVQMELALGALPDAIGWSPRQPARAPRPQIVGEERTYGMGLVVNRRGASRSSTTAATCGYHSDMMFSRARRRCGAPAPTRTPAVTHRLFAQAPRGAVRRQARGRRTGQGAAAQRKAESPKNASDWWSRPTRGGKLAAHY